MRRHRSEMAPFGSPMREARAFDVANHARRLDLRGAIDHAADHPRGLNSGRNAAARIDRFQTPLAPGLRQILEVPEGDAVLRGDHRRLGTGQQRAERGRDGREAIGLERQEHHIRAAYRCQVVGGLAGAR